MMLTVSARVALVFTEMGSSALLTAVLAGALLSISAIHAGE